MRRTLLALGLVLAGCMPAAATTCGAVPFTFVNGQTAQASTVNQNFSTIYNCANTLIPGLAATNTFTGANTFDATVTVVPGSGDAIDLSRVGGSASIAEADANNLILEGSAGGGSGSVVLNNTSTGSVDLANGGGTVVVHHAETVGGTLGVTGTLTASGALTVTGTFTANGSIVLASPLSVANGGTGTYGAPIVIAEGSVTHAATFLNLNLSGYTGYSRIVLQIDNFADSDDTQTITLLFSTNAGVSFLNSNYNWRTVALTSSYVTQASSSDSSITVKNNTLTPVSETLNFDGINGAGVTNIWGSVATFTSTPVIIDVSGTNTATGVNAIKLVLSGGAATAGTYRLIGYP